MQNSSHIHILWNYPLLRYPVATLAIREPGSRRLPRKLNCVEYYPPAHAIFFAYGNAYGNACYWFLRSMLINRKTWSDQSVVVQHPEAVLKPRMSSLWRTTSTILEPEPEPFVIVSAQSHF